MEAVITDAPVTVVVAGPGAGKTTTLVNRIVYLVNKGVPPGEIAVMTFTNAAARELKNRLGREASIPEDTINPDALGYVGTLHSFILMLFREYGSNYFPALGDITIMDGDMVDELLATTVKEARYKGSQKALRKAVNGWPDNATRPSPEQLVARRFFQSQMRSGVLDFDCLLQVGLNLVERIADSPVAAHKPPFTHLLVDEFQDSGLTDGRIYDALKMPSVFYVGDTDQAIYGFRGGDVNVMLAKGRHQRSKMVVLFNNYRSAPIICDSASQLIGNNTNRFVKRTVSARPEITGAFVAGRGCASMAVEFNEIASDILKDHDDGFTDQGSVRVRGDLAILCPTNKQVKECAATLVARGIECRIETMRADRPKDWNTARLAAVIQDNPHRDLFMERWLRRTLDGSTVDDMLAGTDGKSLQTAFKCINQIRVPDFPVWLRVNGISDETVEMLTEILNDLDATATFADVVVAMAGEASKETVGEVGPVVTTIHAFKGREADAVWLPCWTIKNLPGTRKDTDIEERRRLAYVAITRARQTVRISWHKMAPLHPNTEQLGPVEPSPFLAELGIEA